MKDIKKVMNSNFLLFLLGRMISDTGTSIQIMILPLYIIDAGGAAATVGVFSFLSLLPALLIYPFAGVIGDRFNRKLIMVVTDFISASIIFSLTLISFTGRLNIGLLLGAQVFISLLNGMFEPATRGMIPELVPEDKLTNANSLVAVVKSLSYLLGPVVGALLYGKYGITILFLVNGTSFLFSGISEIFIQYTHLKQKDTEAVSGILMDLLEGIQFLRRHRIIAMLCYFLLMLYFFVQPIFAVVLPLYFKTSLNYSDLQYGYLQSIMIVGVFIGSIVVGIGFGKESNIKKPLRIGCILLIVSMAMFTMITFPNVLLAIGNGTFIYFSLLAGALCILSASIMFVSVPLQTYIQRETPNVYMSRVFSLVAMITRGGMPLGALIYGFILDRIESHWGIFGVTLLLIIVTPVFFHSLKKVSISDREDK